MPPARNTSFPEIQALDGAIDKLLADARAVIIKKTNGVMGSAPSVHARARLQGSSISISTANGGRDATVTLGVGTGSPRFGVHVVFSRTYNAVESISIGKARVEPDYDEEQDAIWFQDGVEIYRRGWREYSVHNPMTFLGILDRMLVGNFSPWEFRIKKIDTTENMPDADLREIFRQVIQNTAKTISDATPTILNLINNEDKRRQELEKLAQDRAAKARRDKIDSALGAGSPSAQIAEIKKKLEAALR